MNKFNFICFIIIFYFSIIVYSHDIPTKNNHQHLDHVHHPFFEYDHEHNTHDHINHLTNKENIKIGIIGSGIGGSSCSYYIYQELKNYNNKDIDIEISVYEREKVGGRTRNLDIDGEYTELGGSVVHPLNENVIKLVNDLGLKFRKSNETGGKLIIWNGKETTFSEHPFKLINHLKMLFNYYWSPITFKNSRDDVVDKFLKGYNISEPFKTVEEFYDRLGLLNVTKLTAKQYFVDQLGISKDFVENILSAGMRVNYNQDYDQLSAFAAFIGLVGTENGLLAIDGGNYKLSEALLKSSSSKVIDEEVVEIEKVIEDEENKKYYYNVKSKDSNGNVNTNQYDIVVISTPIEFTSIKLKGLSKDIESVPKKLYKQVHVHMLAANSINSLYFDHSNDTLINCVLTAFNKSLPFFSLCQNTRGLLNDGRTVFKIFAPSKLSDEYINQILVKPELLHYHVWNAYPVLTPVNHYPSIIMDNGLFYNNAFEHSISTIETTTISSKNTARLISKLLKSKSYK